MGALSIGALAIGALAVGALAIGRLAVRKARFGNVAIDELSVRRIRQWGIDQAGGAHRDGATTAVAEEYASLCRKGKFDEAMTRFFSEDHVRIESVDMTGPAAQLRGVPAIRENSRGFDRNNQLHGFEVDGPFVGDDRFAVRFGIDATYKPTGARATIPKMDLYTVGDGRIVRSEVFYGEPPPR